MYPTWKGLWNYRTKNSPVGLLFGPDLTHITPPGQTGQHLNSNAGGWSPLNQLHILPLSSTQGPHFFSTQNPSVQHPPQFNTPSVQHTPQLNIKTAFSVSEKKLWSSLIKSYFLNWGGCWTEGILVLNWGIFEAEKEWPFCVELMCWTEGDQ